MSLGSGNLLLASAGDAGYNLTRSLRFRASASAYLNRTPAAAGNRKTFTLSTWVKRGTLGARQSIFDAFAAAAGNSLEFQANDTLEFYAWGGASVFDLATTQVFRDPSASYHVVVAVDTTQATAANRIKLYINGSQVTAFGTATYPSLNADLYINNNFVHNIGRRGDAQFYFDGYQTEDNFVDGLQLTPSSFGSTNALTGVWQPARYTGTYGTNGFYLNFTDNSALTTSSNVGLGRDYSGNGNYWTTNNISITAGVTYDSMTDVPTLTSATAANFAVVNPLDAAVGTASNGNLSWTCGASNGNFRGSIAIPASGKFYFEGTVLTTTSASVSISFGVAPSTASLTTQSGQANTYHLFAAAGGYVFIQFTNVGTLGTFNAGDVLQVAVDVTNSKLWLGKNNVFYDSSGGTTGNPTTGANPVTTNSVVGSFPFGSCYQDTLNVNFGQRPFSYTPPTGFVALNTFNLPTSTIVKGNSVMDATLYSGNSSTQNIVNAAGFKPDLVWPKARSVAYNNTLYDSVRGATKTLFPNLTNAEVTEANTLTAFNSNGFSLGSEVRTNENGNTYVAWQWQAGQGSTSSNTNGTITSTVSVNASAGFSVVTFTEPASGTATVGHGLGVAPQLVILKSRGSTSSWPVYHSSVGNGAYLLLNGTNATTTDANAWNSTSPTSTVFSVGTSFNGLGTMVAYCWTPIAGYSAFGSYTGNGSTDGTFVYTGFRPKFVMMKSTSTGNWFMYDTSRSTYNLASVFLYSNLSNAEVSALDNGIDMVSNGFKLRVIGNYQPNTNGGTFIYMAFAENPFKNSLAR